MAKYGEKLRREGDHWGKQLHQADGLCQQGWLDHPQILGLYMAKRRIDGYDWPDWLKTYFGQKAGHAVDLGCGSGSRGLQLLQQQVIASLSGYDISDERLAQARANASRVHAAAEFINQDANTIRLQPDSCDLIISCHSFHHFTRIEHIMAQVAQALTERGLFILEEYTGPSIFQWTDAQLAVVNDLIALLPEEYRRYLGLPGQPPLKRLHERPKPEDVQAVSPFEAIRSAAIIPLFHKSFVVLHQQSLGGAIQHLLYQGILHNFAPDDERAGEIIAAIDRLESRMVASGVLHSDFTLLVGRKPAAQQTSWWSRLRKHTSPADHSEETQEE